MWCQERRWCHAPADLDLSKNWPWLKTLRVPSTCTMGFAKAIRVDYNTTAAGVGVPANAGSHFAIDASPLLFGAL